MHAAGDVPDPGKSTRRKGLLLLWPILILLALYLGVVSYVYVIQRSLIYFPSHTYSTPREAQADPSLQELAVQTADGIALKGWYAPSTRKTLTMVYFHGNGDNLVHAAPVASIYIQAGYVFLIAEYRGYSGLPGQPTEAGLYEDARAYLSKLIDSGVDPKRIVLLAHSLGTGVATQMATEFQVAGLILLAPYRSLPEVGQSSFPWLPVGLMMTDRFETFRKIGSIHLPLLVANGGQDRVIPPQQGRSVFALANQPKTFFFASEGGHNDMFNYGFTGASLEWLGRLAGLPRQ